MRLSRMNLVGFVGALCAVGMALGAVGADKVTLASLLAEMTDPDANTYLPSPRYTARLWSSHDRGSTLPGKPGWFANADASQFMREENDGGRREHVLLDAQGPGAITRFWVTVARTEGKGTLRFYIDGKLSVEGEVLKLLSGGALCAAPLSDSVSTESPYLNRGHNLYLPIPYAKSCKVTYESETLDNPRPDKDGKKHKESFYYNVETRTYASGTVVESFSLDVLQREKAAVDAANRVLARRQNGADKVVDETLSFDGTIPPGESVSRTVTREKGGAIRRLAMAVANGKKPQALRSTVLEISFDGERTVLRGVFQLVHVLHRRGADGEPLDDAVREDLHGHGPQPRFGARRPDADRPGDRSVPLGSGAQPALRRVLARIRRRAVAQGRGETAVRFRLRRT